MFVKNEELLSLTKSWKKEDVDILKSRLGKKQTNIMQVYNLFQPHVLMYTFFLDLYPEYNKLVKDYQNDNSDSLEDVIKSHRIAENRAFKEVLRKAGK